MVLNIIGKQAIKLRMIEETSPKLKDKWCVEQQDDMNRFFEQVGALVDAAANAGTSPMAYAQMQQAKADFVIECLEVWQKYRLVDEPSRYRNELVTK